MENFEEKYFSYLIDTYEKIFSIYRITSFEKFLQDHEESLPLKHPVNIAYEAATADLKDVNQIDSYHLEAYGEKIFKK